MSDEFTEPLRLKIMRMFLPINPKRYDKSKKNLIDVEIIDPLERFEKSILKESESKKDSRNNSTA